MQKKIITLVASSFVFISCNEPIPSSNVEPCELDTQESIAKGYDIDRSLASLNSTETIEQEDQQEDQRGCKIPVREPSANLGFHVELTDFNVDQEAKMRDALRRAKIVMNSKAFKEKVINHAHNGTKTFFKNNGQTNQEIYQTIMEAAETLLPQIDNEMDLDITLYHKNNSTVGYTYPDTTRIWVNNKFFASYSLGQVANNAVHEWTHKIGYGHSYYNNPDRPYTVPYAVGEMVEELVDGM